MASAGWYSNSPCSSAKQNSMCHQPVVKKCTDPRCLSACRRGGWTADAAWSTRCRSSSISRAPRAPCSILRGISVCRTELLGARRRLFYSFARSQQWPLCCEAWLAPCSLALSPQHAGSSREGRVAAQCKIPSCRAPWIRWEFCQCH